MRSDPSGADIELDGRFAGDTPSDLQLAEGEHTISVYLELPSGMFFLGRARLIGNNSFDEKIPLKGLKEKPKRAVMSY